MMAVKKAVKKVGNSRAKVDAELRKTRVRIMTVARQVRLAAIEWSRGHSLIDIDDPSDLRYWCAHFECTGSALRAAVRVVGPSPRAVHARLLRTGDSRVRVFVEPRSVATGTDVVA